MLQVGHQLQEKYARAEIGTPSRAANTSRGPGRPATRVRPTGRETVPPRSPAPPGALLGGRGRGARRVAHIAASVSGGFLPGPSGACRQPLLHGHHEDGATSSDQEDFASICTVVTARATAVDRDHPRSHGREDGDGEVRRVEAAQRLLDESLGCARRQEVRSSRRRQEEREGERQLRDPRGPAGTANGPTARTCRDDETGPIPTSPGRQATGGSHRSAGTRRETKKGHGDGQPQHHPPASTGSAPARQRALPAALLVRDVLRPRGRSSRPPRSRGTATRGPAAPARPTLGASPTSPHEGEAPRPRWTGARPPPGPASGAGAATSSVDTTRACRRPGSMRTRLMRRRGARHGSAQRARGAMEAARAVYAAGSRRVDALLDDLPGPARPSGRAGAGVEAVNRAVNPAARRTCSRRRRCRS